MGTNQGRHHDADQEHRAQEFAPHRVRVNSIAPGVIRTPINTAAWSTPEAYRSLMTLVPYGRIGEPEDVARAAVWLAADESDYLVGATVFVDGGMTLSPGFTENGCSTTGQPSGCGGTCLPLAYPVSQSLVGRPTTVAQCPRSSR